jgi:hypothetical protein
MIITKEIINKKIIEQAQVKNSNPANNSQEAIKQKQIFEPNEVCNSATWKMVSQEIQTQKDDKKK